MKFVLLAGVLILCGAGATKAQSCLTPEDVKRLETRVQSGSPAKYDKKLNEELIKMAKKQREMLQQVVAKDQSKKSDQDKLHKLYEEDTARLCEILKDSGWPTLELVGESGVTAAYHILKNSPSYELQRDLLPVILAAIKKDEKQKPEFAGLFDRLRVSAGMRQLFGTQAASVGGFIVLYPIEDEANVDARRTQFGMVDMRQNIQNLQRIYGKPVIKSRQAPSSRHSKQLTDSIAKAVDDADLDPNSVDPSDVIRTETNLVNLNVSVFNNKLKMFVGELKQEDFRVLEDGQEQTVTYFASTDVPFDLVLLVDLSGSTLDKRDLIKKSTLRFIEAARPNDRIAIVTFHSTPNIVSPLTLDRAELNASVENMNGQGGSHVWDSLKFALDNVMGPQTLERRRAIVLMSDGVDGALARVGAGRGSTITFANLLEHVRQTDVLIVPIYLDTEESMGNPFIDNEYENARRTLSLLAQESGGSYYKASKLSDLNGVYEQVINDLGKVYSLGYKPTNPTRDGSWRSVQISIANRPDLVTRARPGYYAQ
ncbi:MAG TPA: VWA domain-containing protein [Pyrinomonadaceae bacterium]|nr:VWA domain-containing protein [Pyrinomonadaceae bacterium]